MKYFKFYKGKKYNIDAVKNFKFFASLPMFFNDPFEGLMQVTSPEMQARVNEIRNRTCTRRAVVCLSHAESDDLIKENIQMWSHYANNHQGFCVEYNDNILDGLTELKDEKKQWKLHDTENIYMNVEYTNDLFPVSDIGYPDDFVAALGHKETNWKREQETRLVYRFPYGKDERNISKNRDGAYISIAKKEKAMNAIYLGACASLKKYSPLIAFAERYSIPCYKMELSHTEFKLEIKSLPI